MALRKRPDNRITVANGEISDAENLGKMAVPFASPVTPCE